MPLYSIKNPAEATVSGIWKIDESKAELRAMLGNHLTDGSRPENPSENIGIHWFASRVLLQRMFDAGKIDIHKNQHNKPTLYIGMERYFISITHSYKFAGVIASRDNEVGIDIEKIDERINRVSHKFMNKAELDFAGKPEQIHEKTLIWAAKETMYKVYGNRELDFREHLFVQPFTMEASGKFNGYIHKDQWYLNLKIFYERFDDYVLTYCIHQ